MSQESESKDETLSTAMKAADAAHAEDSTLDKQLEREVGKAIKTSPPPQPPARRFNTHSASTATLLAAEGERVKMLVSDIDDKIAALNEERTDAMLAYSMLAKGLSTG